VLDILTTEKTLGGSVTRLAGHRHLRGSTLQPVLAKNVLD